MNDPVDPKGPARARPLLERGAVSATIASILIAGAAGGGFWLRDREALRDAERARQDAEVAAAGAQEKISVLTKIAEIERVFAERAAQVALSQQEAVFEQQRANAEQRLLLERAEARILAAIAQVGERVSRVEQDHNALKAAALTRESFANWSVDLDTLNPALVIPTVDR
jgi:vacuolar-type H+-ATPase subunit I/STV1